MNSLLTISAIVPRLTKIVHSVGASTGRHDVCPEKGHRLSPGPRRFDSILRLTGSSSVSISTDLFSYPLSSSTRARRVHVHDFGRTMPLSPEDIVRNYVDDGSSTQRVNRRKARLNMAIVEPNPAWPQRFQDTKARIEAALGSTAVAVLHAGSTSVPGLPAKDVIDVDLVVKDIVDEDSYVAALERSGFLFLLREPDWHQHRFFVDEGDCPGAYPINLHVFGPDCPEVERHRIFREWLFKSPDDLQLYATVKRECAASSEAAGESMQEYTVRKNQVVGEILNRAFRDLGYIQ